MEKTFTLLLILSSFICKAQITKIEHFFASSPQVEKLFQFFSTILVCLSFGFPEMDRFFMRWGCMLYYSAPVVKI